MVAADGAIAVVAVQALPSGTYGLAAGVGDGERIAPDQAFLAGGMASNFANTPAMASPGIAKNRTLSRQARSMARELTRPCEYPSSTAHGSIAGSCAGASASSLQYSTSKAE